MPQGFHVPEQRAERSRGPYATGGVGATRASAVAFLTCIVGFVSIEMAGLRPTDSLMSFAQLKGSIQPVDSSVWCVSMCASFIVLSSYISSFT